MRRLLLAYSVNELGTWLGYVALALGVYDQTKSALATAGLFIARGLLPALLSPALAVRVERARRRGGLAALYVAEGLLTLGLAVLIWRFWLPGVLILVALDGIFAVTATALVRATGARIAEQEEGELGKRRANAAVNMVFMVSFAVGPAVGGVLVSAIGGRDTLAIDALSFLGCALILVGFDVGVSDEQSSIVSELVTAWRLVRGLRPLRALLITEAVAMVFFASAEPVEIVYAKATLSAGDVGLGLLVGFWGVGAALGSLVFARSVHRSLEPMLMFGTLLVGLAFLGFAAAPSVAVACVAALIGGVGNGVQWPAFSSAVQRVTPSKMQGLLMVAVGSIGTLCPSLGFALGGVLVSTTSTRIAMLVAGAVASSATLGFARVAALSPPQSSGPEPADS